MTGQREFFSSRIGFILAAAGSAIGLGAIWKFPYMTGQNGGGAFLMVYLAVVALIGLTMILAEMALGRATHTDAVGAFRRLGGGRWRFFGYFSLLAAFLILSFYCVVGGWTVGYLVKAVSGSLFDESAGDFKARFQSFVGHPLESLFYFIVFMGMTTGVILGGVTRGIERLSKVLMPLLFLLMLVMIVRALTLDGAMEGVRFYLTVDFSKITGRVLIDVLGFACFSLSLGFAGMLTYGSYMQPGESLIRSAVWVVILQTICCILAGFMVLPAVFAFGFLPSEGPGLTYITLPAVFSKMVAGQFFAVVFFSLFLMAALTSSISILEPIVTWLIDQFRMTRKAAGALVSVASTLLGISACWSFGAVDWTFGVADLPAWLRLTPFEFLDYITLNVMMPVNALAVCLLMGWVADDAFRQQLYPAGTAFGPNAALLPRLSWLYSDLTVRFVAPAVILVIMASSVVDALKKAL
ncbi:sodium-dependent transporter [Phaeovibrio sulfidiphilus]|uniref:Transporter n=1 Tax=Phaeovibrio sulfidiphilus TaxID=1220600 RepID=A0A8J7CPI5_9PROT|nr:sodium-dependent transporter [Phaeovibrio sulfidiphilus]MBE1237052.1 sodium-dependent transporter [Phaeovibrio sulfidiphilus]